MCKLINRKISGGHGWQNQIWKKKRAHEGYKTGYPQSERSVSNFCSPFPEVHRACPTPIDRSPKNIEGFENILAEQKKKQEYLKRCYHLSWNHENVTSPRLALRLKMTSSFRKFIYFKINKRESEIEPLQSAQTIIHQKVLTAVSSLTILVALLSFCFIVCRASFCCACSSLIRSNASCSYFVQRNGKGSGINSMTRFLESFSQLKVFWHWG